MSSRPGLSIVELLVALMLVSIALLGMAGSTAVALRQITDANGRRRATTAGMNRIHTLTAQGCLAASSGTRTDPSRGLREHWVVTGTGNFAHVTDTVAWQSPRGERTIILSSAFPC